MKKDIVVTGAAGFLGARTAKFLANYAPQYRILATSRRHDKANELAAAGSFFEAGDLCEQVFCETITQNAEIVVHCAALSSPYGQYEKFYQSNVVATEKLVLASIKNKVKRFIFVSTPSIYFSYQDRWNVKESEPLPAKMVNHYAATKLIAEKFVLSMNQQGIETIALRPRAIIGAEDTVIFPRVLEAYHKGKLKIIGNGKNICDFTCVRNVIEAIICCIHAPQNALGEAYNITDGEPIELWAALNYAFSSLQLPLVNKKVPLRLALWAAEIVELKARLLRETQEPALTKYGVGILANNFTLDISKAKKMLAYQPIMKTFEGIQEYVEWHKNRF